MHGDADTENRKVGKQMIDPELKFKTKFRNNCWSWMLSSYLECGISGNNSVQKAETNVLISNSLGVSARSQYVTPKVFQRVGSLG